jgi:hypothetical protein
LATVGEQRGESDVHAVEFAHSHLANGVRHSACIDATDETASSFHEEFAVPGGGRRQPDFGLDFRIGRRPESNGNPTVSCGLDYGGDLGQVRHVGTRCLGGQRNGEKEEQAHAHRLLRSGARRLGASYSLDTEIHFPPWIPGG